MSFAFTPTRQKLYGYIVLFKRMNNGNSPSIRQMADVLGRSTSVVSAHLARLEAIGLIRRGRMGESRMIEVIGGKWTPPAMQVVLTEADADKLLEVVKA